MILPGFLTGREIVAAVPLAPIGAGVLIAADRTHQLEDYLTDIINGSPPPRTTAKAVLRGGVPRARPGPGAKAG